MRRIVRWSSFLLVALVAVVATSGPARVAPASAATITYPDLQMQVPTADLSIGHPTASTRELRYTHIISNTGAAPLEMRPDYNPSTGIARLSQALFSAAGSGWTFVTTAPIVQPAAYDPSLAKYRFPLGSFGLYSVGQDGSPGSLVAASPKDEFCMTEDTFLGGVPNTPPQPNYPPNNCGDPTATLGLDVGWGDRYDEEDPGQAIDLTAVPDGTYWLRCEADAFHYLAEANTANNITDTEISIAGDQVTVLQQTHPDSTPPSVAITSPAQGASVSGTVTLTASASGPAPISSVRFLLDGQSLGPALTSAPYTFAWNTGGVPLGLHVISAQAIDSRGFVGTAPAVSITIAQQVGGFTVEVTLQQSGVGTATTPAFSTSAAGEVLLAFVSSDGASGGGQTATVSGAGLAWSLAVRSNGEAGVAEIWKATAPGPLTGVIVTSTASQGGFDQSLTVLAVQGTSGVGAVAAASAPSGAPAVRLTATAAGSWALGAGNDWDAAVPRTLATGQVLISQVVDSRVGDTFWAQATSATSTGAGQSVTLADTAPTGDRWNLAALELLPGDQPPPPPPDTQPPVVSVTNPVAGQTVSGTTPIAVSASDNVGVTSVQVQLDGQPLGSPLTTAPYGLAWDTTKVANGSHQLGATAVDAAGNVGTAATVTVSVANPLPPMTCFTIDARTFADGHGTVTTAPFHTGQPGELLLAFAASDGPSNRRQSLTVSGAGLQWTLVRRANSQHGTAEIWRATAPAILTGAAVTSTQSAGGFDQSLTVIAIQGTDGTGGAASAGALTGAPHVTLTTTKAGSLVFGVGNDWDTATARTVGSNQLLLHQWVDDGSGDTFWSQNTTAAAGPAGSAVTIDDTAPTTDRWNLAAVEVLSDDG